MQADLVRDVNESRIVTGTVSVCIPAYDEQATLGAILDAVPREVVDEIVVVDDGSVDDTARVATAAGVRVVSAAGSARGLPAGKGAAMRTALAATAGDIVVFLDADVTDFGPAFVTRLLDPLATDPSVMMTKASYERSLGRVTELVARPLLARCFPHLACFRQPLAGEFAVRRPVLAALTWPDDYGVDIAILIDVASRCGREAIVEVDLGRRTHRNRPLGALALQARQVQDAVLDRYLATEDLSG